MRSSSNLIQAPRNPTLGRTRAGLSTLDVLVALTLLTAVLSVSTPLLMRHARLLKSQRDYRLALDELSNQLDRLTAISTRELPDEINKLAPSEFLTERIPGIRLGGELKAAGDVTRVTLRLSWPESMHHPPVSLAAWVLTPPGATDAAEGEQP